MNNDLTTTPVVTVKDNAVVANSRDVADFFGKEHRNVLRDIEHIQGGMLKSEQTLSDWFGPVVTVHEQNKVAYRSYDMTRDGFTLLVMGYTGPDAMRFKVRYIQEFNRMEEALKAKAPALPTSYKEALLALVAAEEEKERLVLENQKLLPKADAWTRLCDAEGTITSSVLASTIGVRSAQVLHTFLHESGIIRPNLTRSGKIAGWLPTADYSEKGYHRTTVEEHGGIVRHHTRWTPAGAAFIAELMKAKEA